MLRTLFLQPPNQSLPLYHTAVKDTKFTYLPTDLPTDLSPSLAHRGRESFFGHGVPAATSVFASTALAASPQPLGRSVAPSFLPSFLPLLLLSSMGGPQYGAALALANSPVSSLTFWQSCSHFSLHTSSPSTIQRTTQRSREAFGNITDLFD